MIATVGMSFSGVGAIDATATAEQNINSLKASISPSYGSPWNAHETLLTCISGSTYSRNHGASHSWQSRHPLV